VLPNEKSTPPRKNTKNAITKGMSIYEDREETAQK
jgi:hypothetical protein